MPTERGVVLCGGRSSRFGANKALAKVDGVPMVLRACHAVEAATGGAPAVLLTGEADLYAFLNRPVVRDTVAHAGPAQALHNAAAQLTEDLLLVVPCDMPWLTPEVLRLLVRRLDSADACVIARDENRLHPFPGVYRRTALCGVDETVQSLHELLQTLGSFTVVPQEEIGTVTATPAVLNNVNHPHDLLLEARR